MASRLWPADPVAGAPAYTGRALRQAFSAWLAGATAARPLGAKTGIRQGPTANLVTATSTTWTVNPHSGTMDLALANEAGPYQYAFDSAQVGAMTPAPSAPNSRIDIVWVRYDDPSEGDGSASPQPVAGYTAGVAASSNPQVPSPPTVGGRSPYIILAQISVPNAGAPVVTITAPFSVAAGGRLAVYSQAERNALAAYNGLHVHRLDTGDIESYHNGWRTEFRGPVVAKVFNNQTTDVSGYVTIAHGLGFTPTSVVVTPNAPITAGGAGAIFGFAMADSLTASTARVRCLWVSGAAINAGTVSFSALFGA